MPSRTRLVQTAGLLALAAMVAVACNTSAANKSSALLDTEWVLGTVEGAPVVSGTNATLAFGLAQAAGFAGCNQFTTSYTTNGSGGLSFGPIASTRKLCDEATNTFEANYFAALAKVVKFAIANDQLTLYDRVNTAVLTFGQAAPATVEGPWNVTMVNNGSGAVASVPAGISASVAFLPNNIVEGFGGCNNFSGTFLVKGADTISIGPLMGTKMACGDATDQFEAQLMTALQNSTKWSVSGGTLDLRDDSGAQQVEAQTAIGH